MSLHPHHTGAPVATDLLSAIDELAQNTKNRVQSRRVNNRIELDCAVKVEPANSSERGNFVIEGRCRDLSPTGGRLVLDRPMMVGDIFFLHFQGEQFNLDSSFIRCMRCHLVREGQFEIGISFLSPFDLSAIQAPQTTNAVAQ